MNTNDDTPDPLDERLDAMLRGSFSPPPDASFANLACAVAKRPSARWWVHGLLAAAALLVSLGVWILARDTTSGPEGHDGQELGALWAAAYEHAIAGEASGAVSCCDPDLDFCATCEQQFSVRLSLGGDNAELTLRGCYRGLPTGGCVAALIDTPNGPVGVFAISRERDPAPQLPASSALQLVRRELGPLVLYAVAGRQQTEPRRALDRFVSTQ